jgi:hypothetical protein
MLSPDLRFGHFPRKKAHLERQEEALFCGHRPLNLELDGVRLETGVGRRHGQMLSRRRGTSAGGPVSRVLCEKWGFSLPASNGPDHDQRLFPGSDRLGQRRVRRLMRKILLARKEPQKRPPLLRNVVAYRALQHGITVLERIENGALRNRAFNLERDLAPGVRQVSQMEREYDADHGGSSRS